MIQAGFFECDITPPYMTDCPGDYGKRKIRKISDPLKIRAMALCDGQKRAALIGIDNIGCSARFLRELKAAFPDTEIIVSASHTHYGGSLRDKFTNIENASEDIRRIVLTERVYHDAAYHEISLRQAITAVHFAFESLQDVEFSFAAERVENLIFNRRIRMKDGSVKTHAGKGNPDSADYAGPVDDQLGVMGVWKKDSDELLGFVLNFSCHACINLEGATADFPGVAIDTIRKVYGEKAGAVYVNGASGDVTQIDNMSLKKDTGKPIAIKVGRAIAGTAVKLLATADRGQIEKLDYLNETITFDLKPSDPEEVAEAYEKIKEFSDTPEYKIATAVVFHDITIKNNPHPTAELSVLQIGPLVIASTPGEMFAKFGLDFKAQSKFPFTWFSQLSFSSYYIPTIDAYDPQTGGGYEAATTLFMPGTGEAIVEVVSRLSQQLTPEAAPQPETVEPVKTAWGYNFKRKK